MLSHRVRLTTVFLVGLVLFGAPIALVALAKSLPLALALLVVVGIGNTLVDVSVATLLQRATPSELLGRVFGVLESIVIASIAAGAALTPALLNLFGVRATLVVTARCSLSWRCRCGRACAVSTWPRSTNAEWSCCAGIRSSRRCRAR